MLFALATRNQDTGNGIASLKSPIKMHQCSTVLVQDVSVFLVLRQVWGRPSRT